MLKKYKGSSWVSAPTWKKMSSGLTSGLVSYYKMDETSGTTCTDSVGSNNGTIVGATINQTGKIDKCYDFDGSNDYVNMTSVNFTSNNARTVSSWVYLDSFSGNPYIFSTGDFVNGQFFGIYIREVTTPGEIQANNWGATYDWKSGAILSLNKWQHIVTTYDGTIQKIYLDGVQAPNTKTTTLNTGSTNFVLGNRRDYASQKLNGKIDEVGIWNRALSSEEVSELYNTSKARKLETFDYDYADVYGYI